MRKKVPVSLNAVYVMEVSQNGQTSNVFDPCLKLECYRIVYLCSKCSRKYPMYPRVANEVSQLMCFCRGHGFMIEIN